MTQNKTIETKDYTHEPIEAVRSARKLFYAFGGFCAAGIIVMSVSIFIGNITVSGLVSLLLVLGFCIMAAPCILAFVLKFGIFYDVGPIFTYSDFRVGNIIYRTSVRDYGTQMSWSAVFTIVKLAIILLVSVILTPIITLILYICYRRSLSKAIQYANKNGIDKSKIPTINRPIVYAFLIIVLVLFIGSIIADNVTTSIHNNQEKAKNEKNSSSFSVILKNIPKEYYYKATKANIDTGGFVAEFTVDNKTVLTGKTSSNLSGISDLSGNEEYFIIDNVAYLNRYGVDEWEINNDKVIIDYLTSRHLSSIIGKGAEFIDSSDYKKETSIRYKYKNQKYQITVINQNEIQYYSKYYSYKEMDKMSDEPELSFVLDNTADLSALKEKAKQIIDKTANLVEIQ